MRSALDARCPFFLRCPNRSPPPFCKGDSELVLGQRPLPLRRRHSEPHHRGRGPWPQKPKAFKVHGVLEVIFLAIHGGFTARAFGYLLAALDAAKGAERCVVARSPATEGCHVYIYLFDHWMLLRAMPRVKTFGPNLRCISGLRTVVPFSRRMGILDLHRSSRVGTCLKSSMVRVRRCRELLQVCEF